MRFSFAAMTEPEREEIRVWHYPDPYSLYDPILEQFFGEDGSDPAVAGSYVARDGPGAPAGFLIARPDHTVLDLSFGLRPDLTGRGFGRDFVFDALRFSQRVHAPNVFRVAVAAWDRRALSVLGGLDFLFVETVGREIGGSVQEFRRGIRRA